LPKRKSEQASLMMKPTTAMTLVWLAAMAGGCSGSSSTLQNVNAPTLDRAGKRNPAKSDQWNFLCVDNPKQGDAKYETVFKDIYGVSLERFCRIAD